MEQKYSVVLRGTCQHEFQEPASPGSARRRSNSVILRVREQYVPVASERVALLSSVADIEREILNDVLPEITRLEDVMAVVTASLDRQNKRKEALEHQIAAQKSLLFSPIRILPAEILSLIFSFACCSFEGIPEDMQTLRRGMDRDALNISRTCIFWRNICLSMPTLWTSISINLDTIGRAACPALPIYLARSAKKHLYDRFHLYNLVTVGLYDLKRIRRHYDFAWLNSADNLRTIELVHYASSNGIQCLKDKFYNNVNELTIREHSPVNAIWTISKFPCITDLDLEIEDGHCSSLRSTLLNGMAGLVLPKLDSLDITSRPADTYGRSSEDPITQFLHKITAPCLTSLGLFCSDDNTWSHADFVDFMTRSGIQSRLLQLQLRGPAFGEHELIDTLATLTGLINLEIWPNSSSLTENLLSRLAFRSQETTFLPSLKAVLTMASCPKYASCSQKCCQGISKNSAMLGAAVVFARAPKTMVDIVGVILATTGFPNFTGKNSQVRSCQLQGGDETEFLFECKEEMKSRMTHNAICIDLEIIPFFYARAADSAEGANRDMLLLTE
ncbi:hypothetical protein EDD85DRAFT_787239 [Armillaria nabsnona]|nr:hypothetical protein EDD85DRAFT_787239 [Armillaria nabsnona]